MENLVCCLACVAAFVCVQGSARGASDKMVFPGKTWVRGEAEAFGFDKATLDAIGAKMKKAQANGVLVRDGRLIAEWLFSGPPDKKLMIQSCTKSITSLMLGLAVQEKLIPSLDAPVKQHWPAFETGPYTDKITFRHLVTMTSGMAATRWWGLEYVDPGNIEPGTEYHYHNDQPVALARALTYVYGRELREVLKEKVLSALDTDMKWDRDGTIRAANGMMVPVNHGLGYSHWTARGLAKMGLLYLAKGRWRDGQLLPAAYVKECFTEIPFGINRWRRGAWLKRQPQPKNALAKMGYGLGWWTDKGSNVWAMSGHGGQFCMVLPDHGVVMTKVNDWRIRPFIGRSQFAPILMKCLARDGQNAGARK